MESVIETEKAIMMRERESVKEERDGIERERRALSELKVHLYEERRLFDRETIALTSIGSEV